MSPIANYTTTVTARKSIEEIQHILVKHGAKHILTDYEGEEPVGLAFMIPTAYGDAGFKLPANIDAVQRVLKRQRVRSYIERQMATRVAWRILKDWVRAQAAIIETEMVTIDQVFLPYMETGAGKTLYQTMLDHHLQLPGGEK